MGVADYEVESDDRCYDFIVHKLGLCDPAECPHCEGDLAMTLTTDQIHERFIYHPPSDEGVLRHAALSEVMQLAAAEVERNCEDGREKSLAMTKLEEAKMWASAAVARNPETR